MSQGTLTAAYGRTYKNKAEALTAWESGKDFIFNNFMSPWDGKPCSCRDFPKGASLQLRYGKGNSKVILVKGGAA